MVMESQLGRAEQRGVTGEVVGKIPGPDILKPAIVAGHVLAHQRNYNNHRLRYCASAASPEAAGLF